MFTQIYPKTSNICRRYCKSYHENSLIEDLFFPDPDLGVYFRFIALLGCCQENDLRRSVTKFLRMKIDETISLEGSLSVYRKLLLKPRPVHRRATLRESSVSRSNFWWGHQLAHFYTRTLLLSHGQFPESRNVDPATDSLY